MSDSSAPYGAAEVGLGATSAAATATSLGPETTPDGDSFKAGLLDLDVTPPFNLSSRQQQQQRQRQRQERQHCFTSGSQGATTHGGDPDDYSDGAFQRPAKQLRRHKNPVPALPPAEPAASSPRFAQMIGIERRQLVFGGRDCGADRLEFGGEYESQPLGSEDAGIGAVGASAAALGESSELLPPCDRRGGQERVRVYGRNVTLKRVRPTLSVRWVW